MKKMLWCVLCLIVLIGIAINIHSRVFDKNQYIYEVTVNTMTWVYGGDWLPGRVYYHVENQSTSYDVKRAEHFSSTSTDYGKMLRAPDGWWEDKYNVYKSSWWYIIDGGGPANVSSYTAIIVIHEKD